MAEMVRTHMMLPKEVVEEFDRYCGERKRSEQVAQLMAEWSRREKMRDVFERFAGSITAEDHPEWATREDVYKWVRQLRSEWTDPWEKVRPVLPEAEEQAEPA